MYTKHETSSNIPRSIKMNYYGFSHLNQRSNLNRIALKIFMVTYQCLIRIISVPCCLDGKWFNFWTTVSTWDQFCKFSAKDKKIKEDTGQVKLLKRLDIIHLSAWERKRERERETIKANQLPASQWHQHDQQLEPAISHKLQNIIKDTHPIKPHKNKYMSRWLTSIEDR